MIEIQPDDEMEQTNTMQDAPTHTLDTPALETPALDTPALNMPGVAAAAEVASAVDNPVGDNPVPDILHEDISVVGDRVENTPVLEKDAAEPIAMAPAPEGARPQGVPPEPDAHSAPQKPMPPPMSRPSHGGPTQIPRALAKAEVFVEGDHVVYPTHGVGKVERIATEEIAGHKLELIHITFEENRMTLRVPVAKARTAGLRKLATRKQFDDALAVLKGRARIKRTMWSRRAQEYEAKINSGDPLAIAEVVRDLHRNSGQPDQSFSERQIYEAALDRLAAELAALDKTDKPAAVAKLTEFLKAA